MPSALQRKAFFKKEKRRKKKDRSKFRFLSFFLLLSSMRYYTTPCPNMASATFTNPAMFAPLT